MTENATIVRNTKPKNTVGLKVTPFEHNMLRHYADIFFNQE
jgi:hypothetical protein